jgi:hypothetical protein
MNPPCRNGCPEHAIYGAARAPEWKAVLRVSGRDQPLLGPDSARVPIDPCSIVDCSDSRLIKKGGRVQISVQPELLRTAQAASVGTPVHLVLSVVTESGQTVARDEAMLGVNGATRPHAGPLKLTFSVSRAYASFASEMRSSPVIADAAVPQYYLMAKASVPANNNSWLLSDTAVSITVRSAPGTEGGSALR